MHNFFNRPVRPLHRWLSLVLSGGRKQYSGLGSDRTPLWLRCYLATRESTLAPPYSPFSSSS